MKLASPAVNNGLTTRDNEILKFMQKELNRTQIAARLFISFHTVDTHN